MTEQEHAADAASKRATDQARLRKERREAKLKAGGSARLNKITGAGGGLHREIPIEPKATGAAPDPDHGDIAQHFPASRPSTSANPTDAQIRTMMLGDTPSRTPPPAYSGPGGMGARGMPPPPDPNDPFAMAMHQLMTSPGAGGGAAGGFPFGPGGMSGSIPGGPDEPGAPGMDAGNPLASMLASLQQAQGGQPGMPPGGGGMPDLPNLAGMMGGMGGQTVVPARPTSSFSIWRILHTFASLALATYFVFMVTPFSGTLEQREMFAETGHHNYDHERRELHLSNHRHKHHGGHGHHHAGDGGFHHYTAASAGGYGAEVQAFTQAQHLFFILFATLESLLLTSRFLVEKFSPGSALDTARGGWLWTVAGVLPQPFGGWLSTGLRYKSMVDAVLRDLLLVVFVMGMGAWWRAGGA